MAKVQGAKYSSSQLSNQILGRQGRCLGHHLSHGLRGPVVWMRVLIPFTDELLQLGAQMIFRDKIDDAQPLTLQNTEPLFDLIHP
jgi:hypothetical protein